MSLKSVELQVAIPRTQDVGKMQEHMNQRNVIQHHHTTEEQKVQDEQKRMRAAQIEHKNQGRISGEDPSSQHSKGEQEHKQQKHTKKEKAAQHPFKGKHIDISL